MGDRGPGTGGLCSRTPFSPPAILTLDSALGGSANPLSCAYVFPVPAPALGLSSFLARCLSPISTNMTVTQSSSLSQAPTSPCRFLSPLQTVPDRNTGSQLKREPLQGLPVLIFSPSQDLCDCLEPYVGNLDLRAGMGPAELGRQGWVHLHPQSLGTRSWLGTHG